MVGLMNVCTVLVAVVLCGTAAAAAASALPSESDGLLTTALHFVKECGDKSVFLCMKERALHYVDAPVGDLRIGDGITLVQTEAPAAGHEAGGGGGRSLKDIKLPVETEARELEVDTLLVDRLARFLGTHTLQFKVPRDAIEDMQRSLEEARGKKHGKHHKRLLLPLLLLFKLKAAALLPLVLGFLALIAFKALIIGKLALLLSGIIGLKKLFESKHSSQSYEVVAHPSHQSYDEHSGGGHYGRSLGGLLAPDGAVAQPLAYAAYAHQ